MKRREFLALPLIPALAPLVSVPKPECDCCDIDLSNVKVTFEGVDTYYHDGAKCWKLEESGLTLKPGTPVCWNGPPYLRTLNEND